MKPNLHFAHGGNTTININDEEYNCIIVYQVEPVVRQIAIFADTDFTDALLMAGDYTHFLNDKYVDKIICCEWPHIDRERRIKYHEEQLALLKSEKKLAWSSNGEGVKEVDSPDDYIGEEVDYNARIK